MAVLFWIVGGAPGGKGFPLSQSTLSLNWKNTSKSFTTFKVRFLYMLLGLKNKWQAWASIKCVSTSDKDTRTHFS